MSDPRSPSKILRPYVKLWFGPHSPLSKFKFHWDQSLPENPDNRFNYLTDFQMESGREMATKFTLVDYDFKITESIFPTTKNLIEEANKNAGPRVAKIRRDLEVYFCFGWHTGPGSEDPWATAPLSNSIPTGPEVPRGSSSPVFQGTISGGTLNIGEGLYKWELEIKGATVMTENTMIPDLDGKDLESSIGAPNAYELLEKLSARIRLPIEYRGRTASLLRESPLTSRYQIRFQTVQQIIQDILDRATRINREKLGRKKILRLRGGCLQGEKPLIIEEFEPTLDSTTSQPIRIYHIGIRKDNGVIRFSPDMDTSLIFRSTRPKAMGISPKGTEANIDPKNQGGTAPDFYGRPNLVINTSDREAPAENKDQTKQMASATQAVNDTLSGIKAELTILGDPSLFFASGKDHSKGRLVTIRFYRPPFVQWSPPGLVWSDHPLDEYLSGDYLIQNISHSLGVGRPFETSLSLSRTGGHRDLQYRDHQEK